MYNYLLLHDQVIAQMKSSAAFFAASMFVIVIRPNVSENRTAARAARAKRLSGTGGCNDVLILIKLREQFVKCNCSGTGSLRQCHLFRGLSIGGLWRWIRFGLWLRFFG
jgi:hypothetical protein